MSDNERSPRRRRDNEDPEQPASVIFMEMMRQAAARNSPPAPEEAPIVEDESQSPPAAEPYVPSSPEELANQAAIEAQRVQRVKRRRERKRKQAVSVFGGMIRTVLVVSIASLLVSTIFVWFTDADYLNNDVRGGLQVAMATDAATLPATPLPTPNWLRRIGIVSGHRGPEGDPGAVCPDGLTENSINFNVAQLVVRDLRGRGYSVDLLDEFDPRLEGYQAAALVSIHANTCQEWPGGEIVSGYLISSAASREGMGGLDPILVDCVAQHYQQASGLDRRAGVTIDMTDYHGFREIHPLTPAAIIELGFMLADRTIMTEQPDLLARGIVDGILCFMEPGTSPTPALTPEVGLADALTPTAVP